MTWVLIHPCEEGPFGEVPENPTLAVLESHSEPFPVAYPSQWVRVPEETPPPPRGAKWDPVGSCFLDGAGAVVCRAPRGPENRREYRNPRRRP